MKERIIGAGILTAMMLFSPIAGNLVDASALANGSTQKEKVMWGTNELYDYQIGRLIFTKDVKVYKRDATGVAQFHMNAKKDSMWRVYKITNEGGKKIYDLGAGVRVQQSNLSKYEVAPKDLVAKQVKQNNNGAFLVWEKKGSFTGYFDLPKIHKLGNEDVKNKINQSIENAFVSLTSDTHVSGYQITVLENQNNRFLLEVKYIVTPMESEAVTESFRLKYDLTTGNLID
ncbi:hypothetical protein [Lysinibacillus odysseyi]|nr:hypothetical protein [Lysinibacillus odysseyi]